MKNKQTPKITVVIRKRPLNKKELSKGETDIVKIENRESVVVSEYKQKVDLTKYIEETTFNFDHAFDEQSSNEQIYEQTIRPLIDSAFEGAKISCFAYGQTGSGKTFTMKGDMGRNVPGLYFLAAKQIFNYLEHPEFQRLNIFVSFYEIYCGKLFDLLTNRTQLKIREDKHANINIIGLEEKPIYSANEFLDIIEEGSALRITSQNATNADSSRSHAIMQIHIKDGKKTFTKVSFIDLAGNERGADHMDQNKQTKIDGAEINKSLLALKECIRALDQGKGHTPFRGSKLTMVLKDSFVGFCKTVMIGNVSPNVSSSQNTMNTLRYADRVKQLKKGGENLSKQEMQAKELMLPRAANKNTVKVTIDREDDAEDIKNKLEIAKKKVMVEPERMDIEASKEKQPVTLERRGMAIKDAIVGKKTESPATNFRVQQKKTPGHNKHDMSVSKPQIRGSNENMIHENGNGSRKNLLLNGPLHQKNVNLKKIDQNNINVTNQEGKFKPMSAKPPTNPLSNMPLEQLNRHHFDVMNSLHSEFSKFKENHSKSVKEETILIRDEMMKLGQLSEVDQWNSQASNYLDLVEKSIEEKIRLIQNLHAEVQLLRRKKNEAEDVSRVLQEQKIHQETSATKHYKPSPMQIEFPKGHNLTSSNNNYPSKFVYHSSQPQSYQQYSQISMNQNQNNESHSYTRGNQYHHSYSNVNPPIQQGSGYNGYSAHSSHNIGGYQFSQYHMNNNYAPQYSNHDEQLLEDLPGDENMQRLF